MGGYPYFAICPGCNHEWYLDMPPPLPKEYRNAKDAKIECPNCHKEWDYEAEEYDGPEGFNPVLHLHPKEVL